MSEAKKYRIETLKDIVQSDIPDDRLEVLAVDIIKAVRTLREFRDIGLDLDVCWPGHIDFIDDDEGTQEWTVKVKS